MRRGASGRPSLARRGVAPRFEALDHPARPQRRALAVQQRVGAGEITNDRNLAEAAGHEHAPGVQRDREHRLVPRAVERLEAAVVVRPAVEQQRHAAPAHGNVTSSIFIGAKAPGTAADAATAWATRSSDLRSAPVRRRSHPRRLVRSRTSAGGQIRGVEDPRGIPDRAIRAVSCRTTSRRTPTPARRSGSVAPPPARRCGSAST